MYRPVSEHGRIMEDYARDFTISNPSKTIDLVSLETKDGADKARAYDITSYPAVIVVNEDGSYQKHWEGSECPPLMQELASYSRG